MEASRIDEHLFEALFRQAVIDNFLEELDSLPPDEELARLYTFTPSHEARMQRLFARDARRERSQMLFTWSKRVAAVFLIAVTVLFFAMMVVPQVRAVVIETITEWYEKFVRFTANAPESEKTNQEPGFIPDGFYELFRDNREITNTIVYGNDEGAVITFQALRLQGSVSVDNEEMAYNISEIDGIEFHLFTADDEGGENSIIWDMGNQRNKVTSTISVDDLIRIALSVK